MSSWYHQAAIAGGAVLLLGLTVALPGRASPDAGLIAPLRAQPNETLTIHELRHGETLGGLLSRELSPEDQRAVLLSFSEHASPRRMRVGTEIAFRRRPEDRQLRAVDVTLSPDLTVRLTRDALGWNSRPIETPVFIDTVAASGAIEDVLWNAVSNNPGLRSMTPGDRALVIHRMDQVFQWQVDFSRQIQVGDVYRFVFERQVRPDGTMRNGRLLAAQLETGGRSLQAVYFDPDGDGKGTYYDEEGQSVRRAFLTKPLQFRRISSRYSRSRFHPVLRRWRSHQGVDYAAASGTEIMSTADGVIAFRGRRGGYGNVVDVQHANGFLTRYAHMKAFGPGIRTGVRVTQGQVVGYVGMTGLATGPHLHYEMRRRGTAIDPMSVELPPGDPVPEEVWEEWIAARDQRLALLSAVADDARARTIADVTPDRPLTDEASPEP